MSKKANQCTCGMNYKFTCPQCSVVRMVIMLKNGNTHLKYKQTKGIYANPAWYNHFSKNSKPTNVIINGMYKRFLKSKYANVTNKLMFYDNQTKQHISTIVIN